MGKCLLMIFTSLWRDTSLNIFVMSKEIRHRVGGLIFNSVWNLFIFSASFDSVWYIELVPPFSPTTKLYDVRYFCKIWVVMSHQSGRKDSSPVPSYCYWSQSCEVFRIFMKSKYEARCDFFCVEWYFCFGRHLKGSVCSICIWLWVLR